MNTHAFPKRLHLRSFQQFSHVYDQRSRAGDAQLLVFAAPNDEDYTRVGLSVSKKHGNAVRRARIKRLLREAFRLSRHDLPAGLDLILIPRPGAKITLSSLQKSLKRLTWRLAKRFETQDKP